MIVPTMKNVTIQKELKEKNVCPFVLNQDVLWEQYVLQTTTWRNALVDHLWKEMVMFLAQSVRRIFLNYTTVFLSRTPQKNRGVESIFIFI